MKNFSQYGLLRHKLLPVCVTGHFYVRKGGDRSNTFYFDGDFSHKSQTRHPFPNQTIPDSSRWWFCDSVGLSHVLHVPWLVTEIEVAVSVSLAVWTWGMALFFGPPPALLPFNTLLQFLFNSCGSCRLFVAEGAFLVVSCRGIAWRAHAHTIREHACTHALFSIFRWRVLKAAVCMSVSSTSCLHYIICVARDTTRCPWLCFRQLVLFFLLHTCYWDNLPVFCVCVCVVCVCGWGSFSSPNYHWCCYCDWSGVSPGLHLVSVFTPALLEFLCACARTHTHTHRHAHTHTNTHVQS